MSIANEWARYRELVVSPDVGPEEVAQLHRAFFSGALALSGLIIAQVSGDEPMKKQDEDTIDELMAELRRFCEGRGGN